MLQQTEKIFARDSRTPRYTEARKEFPGHLVTLNSPGRHVLGKAPAFNSLIAKLPFRTDFEFVRLKPTVAAYPRN
jgi:hypothetical protein